MSMTPCATSWRTSGVDSRVAVTLARTTSVSVICAMRRLLIVVLWPLVSVPLSVSTLSAFGLSGTRMPNCTCPVG